jgi:hypothetical protein
MEKIYGMYLFIFYLNIKVSDILKEKERQREREGL